MMTDDGSSARATDEELARSEHGVNPIWYLKTYPDVAMAGMDPVEHYLQFGWHEGRDPSPDFSTLGYLTLHDDVARAGQNPLIHHLRNGDGGGWHWHALRSKNLLYPKFGAELRTTTGAGTPGRRKLLFVGHEATRTGAPRILLTLMEALERLTGAELFLVLEQDGPLLEDYRRVAHVLVNRQGALYGLSLRRLLAGIASPGPEFAICNSAATWRFVTQLRRAGFPRILSCTSA
jgi:hypothetical protein